MDGISIGATCPNHFIEGHPVTVLSEFANEHNVDVIVMGRVQAHGVDKLLGSTTEHILYQVPCCVLAVWIESVPGLMACRQFDS